MTRTSLFRILIVCAGVMGVYGVILAAAAAHLPSASGLASASSLLLFHAAAILGAVALVERDTVHQPIGVAATVAFVIGASLFAADMTKRQYIGYGLFPMAAPTGGTLLIAGWIVLAVSAAWPKRA